MGHPSGRLGRLKSFLRAHLYSLSPVALRFTEAVQIPMSPSELMEVLKSKDLDIQPLCLLRELNWDLLAQVESRFVLTGEVVFVTQHRLSR